MKIKQKKTLSHFSNVLVLGPMSIDYTLLKKYLMAQDSLISIFFIDAGLKHKKKIQSFKLDHVHIGFSFGDGDSYKNHENDFPKSSQNLSDLSFFCQWALELSELKSLIFLGFSLGRLDHILANVGEINHFVNQRSRLDLSKISIVLDNEISFFCAGKHNLFIEGSFSLMSLGTNKIKITGQCEYQLTKLTPIFALSSQGLSNIGHGNIEIEAKDSFMIIQSKD